MQTKASWPSQIGKCFHFPTKAHGRCADDSSYTKSLSADDTNCNLTKRSLCTNVNEYNDAADLQEM
ncbi:unnamed protein product [Sphenostylis stenocarpa]|uniref:Uncharacterized protein n=1 Tax=Sphenostylis stenocarpa TaxID=92480 RepID=A0AA86W1U3_9FABA|nr:unnamed protein product [Sphenostylis stenocarpa]